MPQNKLLLVGTKRPRRISFRIGRKWCQYFQSVGTNQLAVMFQGSNRLAGTRNRRNPERIGGDTGARTLQLLNLENITMARISRAENEIIKLWLWLKFQLSSCSLTFIFVVWLSESKGVLQETWMQSVAIFTFSCKFTNDRSRSK